MKPTINGEISIGDEQLSPSSMPAVEIPTFYLESKHADIKAYRERDFHYSWVVGDKQLLTVEYIPDNWPDLTCGVGNETVEQMKVTLTEIGFEIIE